MRTAGAVFRKLKEAKFRRWVAFYKKLSRRNPSNCIYNKLYEITDADGRLLGIRLCMLHQEKAHLIEICQKDEDYTNCNAFVPRFTREQIKKLFEEELGTKSIKESKYPEICALEWVLEKYEVGYPPVSWIAVLYFRIKNLILRSKIL